MEYEKLAKFIQMHLAKKNNKCIKIGVINGRCNQIVELNDTDLPLTRAKDVNWDAYLKTITSREFCGTLVLELKAGDVIGFAYSRTYSGTTLRDLLG